MGEVGHRSNDILKFGTHAFAVVHDEPNGNGSVARLEYRKFLQLPIFEHLKVFLLEPGNKRSARVTHFHRQQDKICGHRNFRLSDRPGRRMLRRERWREAEDTEKNKKRSKEHVSFTRNMLAGS